MITGINNSFLYAAKKVITTCSNGTNIIHFRGTCFFLKHEKGLIMVTNRHVVEPKYANPKYKDYKVIQMEIDSYQNYDENGVPCDCRCIYISNYNEFKYPLSEDDDVACLFKPAGNASKINSHIPYSMVADIDWFKTNLDVCDSIAYPGFPQHFDKANNTPIFRMGTIASDPRLNYSWDKNDINSHKVAYEGFSSAGASGSPVFAIQKGFQVGQGILLPEKFYREIKLIGINAGHLNYEDIKSKIRIPTENGELIAPIEACQHSGISYFYKSHIIIDICKREFSLK